VDETAHTRTILHTPADHETAAEDLHIDHPEAMASLEILFSDGRNPAAVRPFFQALRCQLERPLFTIVEAEGYKAGTENLLPEADLLFCSQTFLDHLASRGDIQVGNMLSKQIEVLKRYSPKCQGLVTTMGRQGSLLVLNSGSKIQLPSAVAGIHESKDKFCPVKHCGTVSTIEEIVQSVEPSATLNLTPRVSVYTYALDERVEVMYCTPLHIDQACVVDSTGAGDAFNSGFIFGLLQGFPPARLMMLSTYVAGCSLQVLGARHGVPSVSTLGELVWL
jgi:sugar/nucleoside kinase (ribokinase family)